MECQQNQNKTVCTCTYSPCPRKGLCCQCLAYHRRNDELPGCLFSAAGERQYDRSIENFLRDRQRR